MFYSYENHYDLIFAPVAHLALLPSNVRGSTAYVCSSRRRLKAIMALEHPEKARMRVESAIVMQSLVRRFLARVLVTQVGQYAYLLPSLA